MAKGLGFLAQKSWHVSTPQNQKKLWQAQQSQKSAEKKQKAIEDARQKERTALEMQVAAGMLSKRDLQLGQFCLLCQPLTGKASGFMYNAPPGYDGSEETQEVAAPLPAAPVGKDAPLEAKFPQLRGAPLAGESVCYMLAPLHFAQMGQRC